MFGIPKCRPDRLHRVVNLDLGSVTASVSGPRRPQDRIELGNLKKRFTELFSAPVKDGGFNKKPADMEATYVNSDNVELKNGDILIAAITSCTNTSNPAVLLAAGLLAKKAVEAGLQVSHASRLRWLPVPES